MMHKTGRRLKEKSTLRLKESSNEFDFSDVKEREAKPGLRRAIKISPRDRQSSGVTTGEPIEAASPIQIVPKYTKKRKVIKKKSSDFSQEPFLDKIVEELPRTLPTVALSEVSDD